MKNSFYFFPILLALFNTTASAQYIQVDDNYSAQQLVEALVGNSCAQVSNVTVSGWAGSSGGNSYGYFTAGSSTFPFASGILLSSGFAASAPGPNTFILSDGSDSWLGDADLEAALGTNNLLNATILEFDFIPLTNSISFDYIFASEEYTNWNTLEECDFSDGFAFLLKESGSAAPYQNLAVIPNTSEPVKVTSVRGVGFCPSANEQYFGSFNGPDHPTNFNGQTVILTARANVVAGTQYHIKLAIADQTDTQYDAAIFLEGGSFASVTDLGDDRLLATGNPLCEGQTVTLNAANPDAIGYKWFKDGNPAVLATTDSFVVSDAGTYTVEVQLASTCVSDGAIVIEYALPLSQGPYTLTQCDDNNDGLSIFNLNNAGDLAINGTAGALALSYHLSNNEAVIGMPQITNVDAFANTAANQKIYVRLQNEFGCTAVAEVILATVSGTISTASPLIICDEDGMEDGLTAIDLSQTETDILAGVPAGLELSFYPTYTDALSASNAIADTANFTNTIAGGQTIYARITNSTDCYGITEVPITVFTFPQDFTDETLIICAGSSLRLDAPAGFSYSWNTTPVQTTPFITVTEPGSYSVTLTGAVICEKTITFTVVQSGAATGAEIIAKDFTGGFNSVNVIPEGLGSYEFSIDGDIYQASPIFDNLVSGAYTIYIKDVEGCSPLYQKEFFILDYPKFLTPNGDGVNDVWRIPFMNSRPGITVTIYDRYGKLITGFNSSSPGWDGTLNSKTLPASDYWFRIRLEDGRIIKGHFSLIR